MKAIVVTEFGPPARHAIGEMPDPVAGEGQVVVEIATSEANYPDTLFVSGNYQRKPALPAVPGMGGAGRVLSLGAGVCGLSVGQRVLVLPDAGTHAEKVCVAAGQCIPVPDDVPLDVAASLGLAFQTAYFALVDHGKFGEGQTVLVLGAKGGVGSAAVLLAKALGAGSVIAVTRGAVGAEVAMGHGADLMVDAADPDLRDNLRKAVHAATGGRGADLVIDPVGGAPSAAALRAMAWRGRLVSVGFAAGDIPVFKANYLLLKGLSVCGFQWIDHRNRDMPRVKQVQATLFDLYLQSKLDRMTREIQPLTAFPQVMAGLQAGTVKGKIVFRVS